MIAAAKKCGCPMKTDFRTSPNFTNDFSCSKGTRVQESFPPINSRTDSEKCICPRPNDPKYQKMKGTCSSCCERVSGSEEDENDCINPEKRNKPLSEIVERGLPYKEIEAIINDNRMIIRVQKDSSSREEWDPPCDCTEENKKPPLQRILNSNQNDVIFRKVDLNQCNQNPCRTITVYPHADSDLNQEQGSNKAQKEKEKEIDAEDIDILDTEKRNQHQQKPISTIDLEENPNIFLLRIKKRCENGDGKYNIDLEFRAPRPWLPKPIIEKPLPPVVEKVVESKSEEKKEKGKKGKKGK